MNECKAYAGAARAVLPTLLAVLGLAMSPAASADSDAELAMKAQNPISAMISFPLQLNYDEGYGATGDGKKWVLNLRPVVPFDLNEDWNLISRTIVPLIDQEDFAAGGTLDESGLGDVQQNLFFSPKAPTAGGWIWGVGPALLLPTASDKVLGGEKWALGPTAVVVKQANGWTYGVLGNHLWSVAGEDDRDDISASLIQPFFGYTTRTSTTFMINTESTYDWKTETWSVPVNLMATQMLRVGGQPLTLQAGARYWADSPDGGPDGWGFRFAVTFLFPK
ncbi:hypothetical protein [Thauera sp. SWB20]|uniref:hypothetical protein n=1 Tax=Thauera sp. SWB20 TaxID=1572758 RepID=UPI0005ADADFF|nr:hypothetical protein [Thauera sp. SWB20]KIN91104.1 hypothetical protein PO78_2781 [Thauera sp. SWB20]